MGHREWGSALDCWANQRRVQLGLCPRWTIAFQRLAWDDRMGRGITRWGTLVRTGCMQWTGVQTALGWPVAAVTTRSGCGMAKRAARGQRCRAMLLMCTA